MSANRYKPHLVVLPEDDANEQLANGFWLGLSSHRQFQVLRVAGGWRSVCDQFETTEAPAMHRFGDRHLVMLMDFDGKQAERRCHVAELIPAELQERTFLLGCLDEPECLRADLGLSWEDIGVRLAEECRCGDRHIWGCQHLGHNADELTRLHTACRFLF